MDKVERKRPINGDLQDAHGRFKKGHKKVGGGPAGTPARPIAKQLLDSFVEACILVGYDRDVVVKKDGVPVLDRHGQQIYDEDKRIQGLIPYLQRTVELHRPETLAIVGKLINALIGMLQHSSLDGVNGDNGKQKPTREELERQLARWGINVNIFHGEEGRRPLKLIEHDERGD